MAHQYSKPLSNEDRILILQMATGKPWEYLSDLEMEYFGVTSYYANEMRDIFRARIGDPYAENFNNVYDEYLLDLYQDLIVPPGIPTGLLLALTQP